MTSQQKSINARTDTGRYPGVFLPTISDVVRLVLYLKQRYPGVRILITKRDVEGAFKRVPLEAVGAKYIAARLGGYVFVALTLTFGWEPSPGVYNVFATALSSYHNAHMPSDPAVNGTLPLCSLTYVDDGMIFVLDIGVLPAMHFSQDECTSEA